MQYLLSLTYINNHRALEDTYTTYVLEYYLLISPLQRKSNLLTTVMNSLSLLNLFP